MKVLYEVFELYEIDKIIEIFKIMPMLTPSKTRELSCIKPIDIEKAMRDMYFSVCRSMVSGPCSRISTFAPNDGLVFDPYLWATSRESLIALVAAVFLALRTQLVRFQKQVSETGLKRPLMVLSGFFDSRVNGRNAP